MLELNGRTKAVIQEFDILDDDANIYKQIGPVLLKQDKTEAVMAVNRRLEFIDKEMRVWHDLAYAERWLLTRSSKRIETQIKGIQDRAEDVKSEVQQSFPASQKTVVDIATDHTNTIRGTTAAATATSSSGMRELRVLSQQIRYPYQ
jgi:chaperonin cofactor prefoldin